ncbi:MAG TPA: tetratricopeptide repeat protein [Candidatus Saccharicenans sp.]|jgi:tetratricopeptide (TPR) repeat protein|nr:tetratricopeptide repeat protein [Candidatus Saccharicenans sp.]HPU94022.1 tetratricopeptide repeat protein [Candidatus Saccharicenans sp.]
MKKEVKYFLVLLMSILTVGLLFSQYREYHLFGLVIDSQKQPIAGAEVILQDVNTSRNYRVKTDKNGKYVLSGLPHGKYHVTVKKEGYETRTFDWDFSAPQERMQKVEMETIVLASEQQVKLASRAKEAQQAVNESMEKIKKGDLEGALKILSELARDYPDDSNVRYLLGLTYGRLQRYQEAVVELTRVTELVPEFAPAYLQLGYCYQNLNDQDKALEYYKRAAELDPSNTANLYNLGLILFEKNQIDEALSYFERALAIKADDADTLEMIGRCYVNKGDLPRAVEFLEKARGLTQDEEKIKLLDKFITTLKEQIKK